MRVLLLCLLFTFSVSSAASELVILMSWDGMRHDYPDRGQYPALRKMEEQGVRTKLIPSSPSNTFPGHVTLTTGVAPHVHGILDNRMYDRGRDAEYIYSPDANWINAEPLWIAVERQGKKSATYFWVGSEGDWRNQRASYRIAPFDAWRSEADKVEQIIKWIDLPVGERPSLIMTYWRGADGMAHIKGPDHPDVIDIISEQDEQLQILMDHISERRLWDSTTLIITSDHGMAEVHQNILIAEPLKKAGIGARVRGGASLKRIFLNDIRQKDAALDVLANILNITVYEGTDIPPEWRYQQRTGDIVVTTEIPFVLGQDNSMLGKARRLVLPLTGWRSGAHGFDPNHPDMAAMFLAYGAGVARGGVIDTVQQDQVAATVTGLLGLKPPLQATGKAFSLTEAIAVDQGSP